MIVREPWVSRLLVAAVGVFVLVVSGCAHEEGTAARSESPSSLEAREPLPWGPLVLRGVVTWEGKPVAGVTVSAVPHADVPLSARSCPHGEPGKTIFDECGAMNGELAQTADWLGRRSPLRETQSDADGWFEFTNLRASTYDLWASGPMGTAFVASIPAGANVARIPLEAGRSVTVQVEDGNSGRPLPGARVALLPRAGGYAFLAGSDAGGRAAFPRVPSGEFHAVASSPGRLADAGPVKGDALSLHLYVPRTLSGRVLRESEDGVAGARVQLEGQGLQGLMQTQADGSFWMERLPPGPYSLVAREGQEIATATVRIPEDGNLSGVQLTLAPCGEVAGRVLRPKEAPVPGAEVELALTRDDFSRRLRATTTADGRFRFECVDPGQVRLSVKASGLIPPLEPMVRDMRAGASLTADFLLQPAALARGRILDVEGRGIRGVRVILSPREVPGVPSAGDVRGEVPPGGGSATTAGDGSFEVQGLAAGRYAYELVPEDTFFGARGEVRLPSANLKLKLLRRPVPARGAPPGG